MRVSGASVPADLITSATKPFIGQTMDADGIQKIAAALSDTYAKSNIALYTIVVPGQDFAGGALNVRIVEGYIEHVDIQGQGDVDLVKAYAEKLTGEHPLSRATLQRYVSLIRDIPGLKADIQLLAGSAAGATRMVIKLDQRDFKIGLSLNNNGNPLLGRTQPQVDLVGYGLLREGEQTTLSLSTATDTAASSFCPWRTPSRWQRRNHGATDRCSLHTKTKGSASAEMRRRCSFCHPSLIRSYDENLYVSGI